MRDATPLVAASLAGLLLVAAVAAPPTSLLPTTAPGLWAALSTLFAVGAGVCCPALPRARPSSVARLALVLAPAGAFLLRAAPGPLEVRWAPLVLGLAAGLVGTSSRGRLRALVAAGSLALLAGAPLLARADVLTGAAALDLADAAGASWRPVPVSDATAAGRPVPSSDLVPAAWRDADPTSVRRAGALARTPTSGILGPSDPPLAGARWMPLPAEAVGALLPAGPLVWVVAGGSAGARDVPGATVVVAPWKDGDVRDLDPFDAVVFLAQAPDDEASAAVLGRFVRRGGVLVGPAGADWPLALRRALGAGGRTDDTGPAGAHDLGAGRVGRVAALGDLATWIRDGLLAPRAGTAFDRALRAPRTPAEFQEDPASRRVPWRGAWLAAAWGLALGGLAAWGRRGGATWGVAALAVAGAVGLGLVTPRGDAVRVHPFLLELGGLGGRRVEGIHVLAGPAGWVGPRASDLAGSQALRALGFVTLRFPDGLRLALRPGGGGWLVEEGVGREEGAGLLEGEVPPDWSLPLLRPGGGGASRFRILQGTVPYGGPAPGGLAVPPTAPVVLVRP